MPTGSCADRAPCSAWSGRKSSLRTPWTVSRSTRAQSVQRRSSAASPLAGAASQRCALRGGRPRAQARRHLWARGETDVRVFGEARARSGRSHRTARGSQRCSPAGGAVSSLRCGAMASGTRPAQPIVAEQDQSEAGPPPAAAGRNRSARLAASFSVTRLRRVTDVSGPGTIGHSARTLRSGGAPQMHRPWLRDREDFATPPPAIHGPNKHPQVPNRPISATRELRSQ